MTRLPVTPLEAWVARRLHLPAGLRPGPDVLATFRLAALRRTVAHARDRSPFYRNLLPAHSAAIEDMAAFERLPFTTTGDLRQDPMAFLCLSQASVARVVTLRTSGTTREPKRIFFSRNDLERTIDFFHHGMTGLVRPGERVLILLPAKRPDSVGDLLRRALARMDVQALVPADPQSMARETARHPFDAVVGMPLQVLAMARRPDLWTGPEPRNVLLTGDYVPRAVVDVLRATWNCRVFQHYGMTEMGLGAAVECAAMDGYHLREADLYIEIVDPDTGWCLPAGKTGEVVFTTLNREAMPLVRYRTGDLARFMDRPCPCGSLLRRMAPVQGRLAGRVELVPGLVLTLKEFDEALLPLAGVLDFEARVMRKSAVNRLALVVYAEGGPPQDILSQRIEAALAALPALSRALTAGALVLDPIRIRPPLTAAAAWPAKRNLIEQRKADCP